MTGGPITLNFEKRETQPFLHHHHMDGENLPVRKDKRALSYQTHFFFYVLDRVSSIENPTKKHCSKEAENLSVGQTEL